MSVSDATNCLLSAQLDRIRFEDAKAVKALHDDFISAFLCVILDGEADGGPVVGDDAFEIVARFFFSCLERHT